jgi:FtsZ-binding cell division protein ZapB
MDACRGNRTRLAKRVEYCTNQNHLLEGELQDVKSRNEAYEKENDNLRQKNDKLKQENDKLRRELEYGAFIDFKGFVGSLGTGGYVLSFAPSTSSGMKPMTFFLVIRGCVRTPPDRGPMDTSLSEHLTQPSLSKLGQLNSVMLSTLLPLLSSRLQK